MRPGLRSARYQLGNCGGVCLYVGFLVVSVRRLEYRVAVLSLANQLGRRLRRRGVVNL